MENPVINTLLTRRSIRQYRPNPVEPELLDLILKAGTYAPTGRGSQSPTIVAVTNEADRQALQALHWGPLLWRAHHFAGVRGPQPPYRRRGRGLCAEHHDGGFPRLRRGQLLDPWGV